MPSPRIRLDARRQYRHCEKPPFALGVVCLALASLPAVAQDATVSRPLAITPTLNISTAMSFGDGAGSSGELVTQVAPGIRLTSRSGRVQGTVDYALLGTVYSQRSDLNQINQTLSASGRAEAVPGWVFVDARANIGKVSLSPNGPLTAPGSISRNANERDVLTVAVSPYVRGEWRGLFDYELRLSGSAAEVFKSNFGDSTTVGASVNLASPRGRGLLGWGLQASQDRVDYKGGRPTDNARITASLSYTPDPDLSFALRAGQESSNVTALDKRTYDNWGAGVRWTPTPRTLISVDADRRYYGDSHQVTIEHRFRSASLRFTSARGVSNNADPYGVGQPTTLLESLMGNKAMFPVDATREADVQKFLQLNNLNPNFVVGGGFAISGVTLQRREDLTFTYTAQRTTLSVQGYASTSEIIDVARTQPGLGRTDQIGLLGNVSHRLTPRLSGNVQLGYQENRGTQQGQGNSHLTSLSVGLTQRVNPNTTATAGVRHSVAGGATSTQETTLTGSLSMRF